MFDLEAVGVRLRNVAPRLAGPALICGLALWLCRRFLFSSAYPAGTDTLGFVTRARQNASIDELTSPWAPSSLGAVRQFTLDNLLGALTLVTGDALLTVKLLIFTTLLATGVFAYLLSWNWYRSRPAATVAGLLFITSQAALTRWGSGELNVELAVASAPLLILLWGRCLVRFTVRRAVAFSFAATFVLFVRLDMLLYVVPFLLLQAVVRLALSPHPRRAIATVARSSGVIILSTLGLLAFQIVPIMAGVRAHWLTTRALFSPTEFAQRSLDAYPSLLGFGREIGYLAFTGQQTWLSHPWVPNTCYEAAATLPLLFAVGATYWHRGHRSIFLLASIPLGVFLAKGIREPAGEPYLLAVQHLPVVGNLRDPNRWLIVPSLAVALLASLCLTRACRWLAAELEEVGGTRRSRLLVVASAASVSAMVLLPVAPTVIRGFLTWRPTSEQLELMAPIAGDRGRFSVATIPYDQTYRFLSQGAYRGYEHDLGAESATFTGRPTIADGGWNQQAAGFVAFTSSLLAQGDAAFNKLLATVGVKYLTRFKYPATAPHLLPKSMLARSRAPADGTTIQQRASRDLGGQDVIRGNSAGATLQLRSWAPVVSLRTNLALILGGRAGLAALADLKGIHIDRWAAVTADDALAQGGLTALLDLVRTSNLVVVSNDTIDSVAVLATPALFTTGGITSDPGLDRLTQLLPSDASTRNGSLANPLLPAALTGVQTTSSRFELARRRAVELWTRVETSPTAATLTFRVDGRVVGRITPLSVEAGPMRWIRVNVATLAAGTHTLGVSASPSRFGASYEIDETRILGVRERERTRSTLEKALQSRGARVLFALDVDLLPIGLDVNAIYRSARTVVKPTARSWTILDPHRVRTHSIAGRDRSLALSIKGGRSFYTIAQRSYTTPRDWSGGRYLLLTYKGSGSGNTYHLTIDFDRLHAHSASYDLADTGAGWHSLALSTRAPQHGDAPFDWRHVVSVRITADSRDATGELAIGSLGLSAPVRSIPFLYSTGCITAPRIRLAGIATRAVKRSRCALAFTISPDALGRRARVFAGAGPIAENPPARVSFRQTSPTSYSFAADTHTGGVLVLARGFDPRWKARFGEAVASPLPAFSVVNGYRIAPGRHSGTITFSGTRFVSLGLAATGGSVLLLLVLVGMTPRTPPRWKRSAVTRKLPSRRYARREFSFWAGAAIVTAVVFIPAAVPLSLTILTATVAAYRITVRMLLVGVSVLLVAEPAINEYSPELANSFAVAIVGVIAVACVLLVLEGRKRFSRLAS